MSVILLLACLLLAAVFGVAGAAKLADRAGSRQSMADFGVPVMWTPLVAWLVPLAELTCAVALLSGRWAWLGAIGACALLVAFMGAIAVNMALGRRPDCRCFGQLHFSPAGWPALLRNGVLAGLAAFVAAQGADNTGPGVAALLSAVRNGRSIVPAWAVLLAAAWLIAGIWLYRSMSPNEETRHPPGALPGAGAAPEPEAQPASPGPALPVGTPAPAFNLKHLDGHTVSLDTLRESGRPILLVFTRPHCSACDGVLPDVGRWQRKYAQRLVIVPVSKHSVEANREKARTHDLQDILLQRGDEVGEAYGVDLLPSAVLVTDGRIASSIAVGTDAIRALVETTTRRPDDPDD